MMIEAAFCATSIRSRISPFDFTSAATEKPRKYARDWKIW